MPIGVIRVGAQLGIPGLRDSFMIECYFNLPLSCDVDSICCRLPKNLKVTICLFYEVIRMPRMLGFLWKSSWSAKVPWEVAFSGWTAFG